MRLQSNTTVIGRFIAIAITVNAYALSTAGQGPASAKPLNVERPSDDGVVAGYVQWFVLLPRLWSSRAKRRTSS
jgi:hypothetical protein